MRGSGETINPKNCVIYIHIFCLNLNRVFPQPFYSNFNFPSFLVFNVSFSDFPTSFYSTFTVSVVIAQVPFALLGDRARGIFETVYLDDDLRTWVSTKVLTGSMLWIVDGWHFHSCIVLLFYYICILGKMISQLLFS